MSQTNFAANMLQAIGNTPLVRLNNIVPPGAASVYVKIEYGNPTGSYKDRMALAIIEAAEKRGDLQPGMTVVECTGGSTGTSLAFVCSVKKYRFRVVSSDAFAKEKLQAMRLFGAELEIIRSENGKITPDLIPRMMARADHIGEESGSYYTRQFTNQDAIGGYIQMGREIIAQLPEKASVFCAAVGTAGMFVGVSTALKANDPTIKTVALEPASAPLLSKGIKGHHSVEGIGVGFVPALLTKESYDSVLAVEESAARQMAKSLAAEEGIFAGTSSGLNIAAAIEMAKILGAGQAVVTVACDNGLKYLAGTLFN